VQSRPSPTPRPFDGDVQLFVVICLPTSVGRTLCLGLGKYLEDRSALVELRPRATQNAVRETKVLFAFDALGQKIGRVEFTGHPVEPHHGSVMRVFAVELRPYIAGSSFVIEASRYL